MAEGKVLSIVCDWKVLARLKGNIYVTTVRPAIMHSLKTAGLAGRQEADLEVTELRMIRLEMGATRMN